MRTVMPALQKAKLAQLAKGTLSYHSVAMPKQLRQTRIEKNMSPDEIAHEIAAWMED